MFETEPILWLQSFASPALTGVMFAITLLGYAPTYIALGLALAFGVRLRPGLGVAFALLLSLILTDALKTGLALPRPRDVDERVVNPARPAPTALVARGGAAGFWKLPAPEAIAAVRARAGASYGFPSGHVSAAVAFLVGVALFFRSRRVLVAALAWAPLMALSRMYLGQHFLADVLGGFAVGALAAAAAALLLRGHDQAGGAALARSAGVAFVLGSLTPWVPVLNPEHVGRLIGLVATLAVIVLGRVAPSDEGSVARRCGRVAAAGLVYLIIGVVVEQAVGAIGWGDTRPGALAAAALITTGTFLAGIAIARRAHWYVTT